MIFFCLFLRGGGLLLGLPSGAGLLAGWIPLPWRPALPGKVPLCPVQGPCTPLPSLGPRGAGGHAAGWLWAAQEASSCLPSASTHEPSEREGTTGAPLRRSPVPAAPAQTVPKERGSFFWGERSRRLQHHSLFGRGSRFWEEGVSLRVSGSSTGAFGKRARGDASPGVIVAQSAAAQS